MNEENSIEHIVEENPVPVDGMIFRHDERNKTVTLTLVGNRFTVGLQENVHVDLWRTFLRINLMRGWRLIPLNDEHTQH